MYLPPPVRRRLDARAGPGAGGGLPGRARARRRAALARAVPLRLRGDLRAVRLDAGAGPAQRLPAGAGARGERPLPARPLPRAGAAAGLPRAARRAGVAQRRLGVLRPQGDPPQRLHAGDERRRHDRRGRQPRRRRLRRPGLQGGRLAPDRPRRRRPPSSTPWTRPSRGCATSSTPATWSGCWARASGATPTPTRRARSSSGWSRSRSTCAPPVPTGSTTCATRS